MEEEKYTDPVVESITKRLFERQQQLAAALLTCPERKSGTTIYLIQNPDGTTIDQGEAGEIAFNDFAIECVFTNTNILSVPSKLELANTDPKRHSADIYFTIKLEKDEPKDLSISVPTNVSREIDDAVKVIHDQFQDSGQEINDLEYDFESTYFLTEDGIKKRVKMFWTKPIIINFSELFESLGLSVSKLETDEGGLTYVDLQMPTEQKDFELISGMLAYMEGMVSANLYPKDIAK